MKRTISFALAFIACICASAQGHAPEVKTVNKTPYVRTFSMDDTIPTKSGWAYWYIPSGGVADTLSVKVSCVNNGPATHAPHKHIHDEIFIALEGDVIVHLNGEEVTLHPGDGMYAPSGSYHGIRRADVNQPVKYFVINRETPGGVPKPFPFWKSDYKMADCHAAACNGGNFTYVSPQMSCGTLDFKSCCTSRKHVEDSDGWQTVYIVLEGTARVCIGHDKCVVPPSSVCYAPTGMPSSIKPDKSGKIRYIVLKTK